MPGRPGTAYDTGAPDTRMSVAELPIGQVARRAEVGVQTVRYYERRGPLPPPRRRYSGQRVNASATIDLLRAVKSAQRLGFTLVEIEEILQLSRRPAVGSTALQEHMRQKVLEIDGKIADLYAIRQRLADALHAGCDSLTNCTCRACPLNVQTGNGGATNGTC
jgi:MerR family mercuric resistance operon transcriptional regulator